MRADVSDLLKAGDFVTLTEGLYRGFDAEVVEVVAVGDHWGRSTYTPGDRPGRRPLGVAVELVKGDRPDERVPPQAGREIAAYYAAR
jgi:hypothetical protein